MKNTTELTPDELEALKGHFVTDPAMQAKLADLELDDAILRGRYAKIPFEAEVKVTPAG